MFLSLAIVLTIGLLKAQIRTDGGKFVERQPGFYQNYILKDISVVEEKQNAPEVEKRFKMDMSEIDIPNKIENYKYAWHFDPVSQGNTGTCWCYSTTSLFESEVYSRTNQKIKLSEMYVVYWEYVEKARRFVKERGNSYFSQGSEANAVKRMYKMYGAVPLDVYTGLEEDRKFHTHAKMFKEMKTYLHSVKERQAWNEKLVISTIKSILNHYMGEPPAEFTWRGDGKEYTPKQFLSDVLQLNMDDYIDVISIKEEEYYTKIKYDVPDNWWHDKSYHNVPLDVFMETLKNAIRKGHSVSIGGDVSEPGFVTSKQAAMVPSFDIPAPYINEDARQMRFSDGSTTDDHGMHLVGFTERDGKDWYLVKDSSSGSRNVGKTDANGNPRKEFGYYFFHEDYVKLKMMDYCVHKDALKGLLKKFK